MKKTRIFKSGNSYAVRLPKEFVIDSKEVEILKRGNEIIIRPIPKNLGEALRAIPKMSNDFMAEGREDEAPQERNFKWD